MVINNPIKRVKHLKFRMLGIKYNSQNYMKNKKQLYLGLGLPFLSPSIFIGYFPIIFPVISRARLFKGVT